MTTDFASSQDQGYSVAIQGDGKIVLAGYSYNSGNADFAAMRLNADGSLDTSFNGTGKVTTAVGSGADYCWSMALQDDGKIILAGFIDAGGPYEIALVRYNANGSLDASFNGNGKVITAIGDFAVGQSVAMQTDRKIVVAGYSLNANSDFALVRYNPDGSLDATFGNGGLVTTAVGSSIDEGYSVAIQPDAKIVIAGYSQISTFNDGIAIVRYEGDTDNDGDGISDEFETGTGI